MSLTKRISLREALERPDLLGSALPGDSWRPWRILLIAAMGEALTDGERTIFAELTGREREPGVMVDEFFGIAGRRSGKTRAAGTLAAFVGTLCEHNYLASGERASIPIMAASQLQANKAFQAVLGVLEESPILSKQIETSNSETIRLRTRVDIEVRSANFRTVRGITSPLAIGDEVAFWQNEEHSANGDGEILNAVRPSLATTGGLLFVISSPWAKRGELWQAYRRNYGPDADPSVLVAKGPSKTFNSTLPDKVIARAYERDAFKAAAEFGGEFRDGVSNLLDPDTVTAATDADIIERPRPAGVQMFAHSDMAGGSGQDSATMAWGYNDRGTAIVCGVRERRPKFNPDAVISEFSDHLKALGIYTVQIDRFAAGFNDATWKRHGITTVLAPKSTSEMYSSLVPSLNSGQVRLVDNARLHAQLCGLERRTTNSATGRELISHAPGRHDDIAASVSGLVHRLLIRPVHIETFAAPEIIGAYDEY